MATLYISHQLALELKKLPQGVEKLFPNCLRGIPKIVDILYAIKGSHFKIFSHRDSLKEYGLSIKYEINHLKINSIEDFFNAGLMEDYLQKIIDMFGKYPNTIFESEKISLGVTINIKEYLSAYMHKIQNIRARYLIEHINEIYKEYCNRYDQNKDVSSECNLIIHFIGKIFPENQDENITNAIEAFKTLTLPKPLKTETMGSMETFPVEQEKKREHSHRELAKTKSETITYKKSPSKHVMTVPELDAQEYVPTENIVVKSKKHRASHLPKLHVPSVSKKLRPSHKKKTTQIGLEQDIQDSVPTETIISEKSSRFKKLKKISLSPMKFKRKSESKSNKIEEQLEDFLDKEPSDETTIINIKKILASSSVHQELPLTTIADLRRAAFDQEFAQEKQKLRALFDHKKTSIGDLQEGFKKLCAEREKRNANTCLSYTETPESLCNALYWKIAYELFQPDSLHDICKILLPGVKQKLKVDVLYNTNSSPRPVPVLKCNVTDSPFSMFDPADEVITEEVSGQLASFTIEGDTLFDVKQIARFPFSLHRQFYDYLDSNTQLRSAIYQKSNDLQQLLVDILNVNENGTPPLVVLNKLIDGLALGSKNLRGTEEYATVEAELAYEAFCFYLESLPEKYKNQLLQLTSPQDKTIAQVIKNLGDRSAGFARCTQTAVTDLFHIINNPDNKDFLSRPLKLQSEDLTQIIARYRHKELKVVGQKNPNLPVDIKENLYKKMTVEYHTLTGLLLELPTDEYASFIKNANFKIILNEHNNSADFNKVTKQQASQIIHDLFEKLSPLDHRAKKVICCFCWLYGDRNGLEKVAKELKNDDLNSHDMGVNLKELFASMPKHFGCELLTLSDRTPLGDNSLYQHIYVLHGDKLYYYDSNSKQTELTIDSESARKKRLFSDIKKEFPAVSGHRIKATNSCMTLINEAFNSNAERTEKKPETSHIEDDALTLTKVHSPSHDNGEQTVPVSRNTGNTHDTTPIHSDASPLKREQVGIKGKSVTNTEAQKIEEVSIFDIAYDVLLFIAGMAATAGLGAFIGTLIAPGIGTAIGAAIGAGVPIVTGLGALLYNTCVNSSEEIESFITEPTGPVVPLYQNIHMRPNPEKQRQAKREATLSAETPLKSDQVSSSEFIKVEEDDGLTQVSFQK
ncbi:MULTISPECIES: glycine zipper family protein [Legionella]|uniref:glycine zipper family protein n=1 Tax=Legionella TaxID=445 RepID=UPI00095E2ED1|nr:MULTISPECIES: glycine zipper family protein [Legionella]MBN9228572.1 glycine zipper family protein [Legionella steelei]OJW08079.1 MAG: hypothetical protein BGO44_12335 [Legionella sp. 39-23]